MPEESETFSPPTPAPAKPAATTVRPLRVLHVLAVSLPHQNGYTVRSKYIVETQKALGHDPVVVTSPFYPTNEAARVPQTVAGIHYHRIPHPTDLERRHGLLERGADWSYRLRQGGRRRALRFRRWQRRGRRLLQRQLQRGRSLVARFGKSVRKRVRVPARVAIRFRALPQLLLGLLRDLLGVLQGLLKIFLALLSPLRLLVRPVLRWLALALRKAWAVGSPAALTIRFSSALQSLEERCLLRHYEAKLTRVCRDVAPELIHAHSPYRNAHPAIRVARKLKIPVVYEVRGLWEESGVASGMFTEGDSRYRRWRDMETGAMRSADAVICICEQLRHEVLERGVDADRVFVVPNAVETETFDLQRMAAPSPEDAEQLRAVRARLPHPTVGYVGSIRKLEGVDELVRGTAEMLSRGHDVSLLVVGDGKDLPKLEALADQLGIAENCVFTGRVPHDVVNHYYDLIDVFVVSRPSLRVTRLVTPLKPLEAMALRKALVVSDLPALRELVQGGRTGLHYEPGDVSDLADKCTRLLFNPEYRRELGETAHEWVQSERTWRTSLQGLGPAYDRVLGRGDGH